MAHVRIKSSTLCTKMFREMRTAFSDLIRLHKRIDSTLGTFPAFHNENIVGTLGVVELIMGLENPDANRLICELVRIYVACDDCGHYGEFKTRDLARQAEKGIATYRQLCSKFYCHACGHRSRDRRNLTIRPTWAAERLKW